MQWIGTTIMSARKKPLTLLHGKGVLTDQDALLSLIKTHHQALSDEMMPPLHLGIGQIQPMDHVFLANFRADRMHQLADALSQHCQCHSNDRFCQTNQEFYLFPNTPVTKPLGEVIAQQQLTQLRIAETEKYAHVTFL